MLTKFAEECCYEYQRVGKNTLDRSQNITQYIDRKLSRLYIDLISKSLYMKVLLEAIDVEQGVGFWFSASEGNEDVFGAAATAKGQDSVSESATILFNKEYSL